MITALYKCSHCGKDFTKEGEHIHAIWPLVLKLGQDNKLHWQWHPGPAHTVVGGVRFYHNECFEGIAGKDFMYQPAKEDV